LLDSPTYSLVLDALCYHGSNLVQNPTPQNSTERQNALANTPAFLTSH